MTDMISDSNGSGIRLIEAVRAMICSIDIGLLKPISESFGSYCIDITGIAMSLDDLVVAWLHKALLHVVERWLRRIRVDIRPAH